MSLWMTIKYRRMIIANIINVALYTVALISNAIGFILLWKVQEGPCFSATQRMLLLNICSCELLTSALYIAIRVLFEDIATYPCSLRVYKIAASGLYFWYIGLMTLMTFDRFLTVYFNIRYPLVWSYRKAKLALLLLFLTSVVITIPFYMMDIFYLHFIVTLYWWPILDLIFFVVGVATYSYFFIKIRGIRIQQDNLDASIYKSRDMRTNTISLSTIQTHQQQHQQRLSLPPQQKKIQMPNILLKIKRGFFTPTLLVITFCIFWLIPDQISFWDTFCAYHYRRSFLTEIFQKIIKNLYPFGFISDAVIYIFFQKEVFLYLKRKCRHVVQAK